MTEFQSAPHFFKSLFIVKAQSHRAYDRLRPVYDLYKTSRAQNNLRQSQAIARPVLVMVNNHTIKSVAGRSWSILKILALQWKMVGSCTHTFHGFTPFLQIVERENFRQSQKSSTIGLSDREQSHDQNQSQVIFEHVKKPDAAIKSFLHKLNISLRYVETFCKT